MPQPENPFCFDNIITYKIADYIANEHMEPNYITIFNIIPSTLCLYFLCQNNIPLFLIFLIVRLILDCTDGHVARKYNKQSEFGNNLDRYTDMIFYTILLYILLKDVNIYIVMCILISYIIMMERYYVIGLTEIFTVIEENTIVSVPLISLLLINESV